MSGHFEVSAEQIQAAAQQCGVSDAHAKRALLGLVRDGSERDIIAALVRLGVDAGFLARLSAVPRAVGGKVAA